MKKNLVVVIVLALLIIAGGLYYYQKSKDSSPSPTGNGDSASFLNIKDALNKKISLVCEFEEDGYQVKSYIKNGAVRVSSTYSDSDNQPGEMIMVGNKMYIWDIKTKEGFVYTVEDTEVDVDVSTQPSSQGSQNYLEMINQYKDLCKVATVSDSYFDIPKDVEFQDMSKMFEELQNSMPQYEIPEQ